MAGDTEEPVLLRECALPSNCPSPTISSEQKNETQPPESYYGLDTSTFYSRDATDHEIDTLPHVIDSIPLAAWIVVLAGAAERFTYFGIIAPWQNYMQNRRGNPAIPGALGLGQSTAANIYNAFFLFSFITPMPFALIADIWLGRFYTLMIGLGFYLMGCLLLLATSLPAALSFGAGTGGFVSSMVLIAMGVGAVKATFFPLVGDQYHQKKPLLIQRKDGSEAILDSKLTISFLYNLYYWFTNLASLSSIPGTFLEKHYDFWAAYLLMVLSLLICITIFLIYTSRIVKIKHQGNNLPLATKVLLCAVRNGWELEHAKQSVQLAKFNIVVPWTDHFVDQIKRGLLACRVILAFWLFYLCIGQMYNNLVSQAGQMNLHGIPNDAIQAFSGVACIIFGPIIQALYTFLAEHRIKFGPIARISTAFFFCGAGMAYAAITQKLIYSTGPCYDRPLACEESNGGKIRNEINVWIQLPIYFLLAVAEILGFVTAFEYAYNKAPDNMKTIVQALTQLTACFASALGMALSPVARDPHVLIMYSCLAASMGLCTVVFWWIFEKYDKLDLALDQMDGSMDSSQPSNV